MFRPSVLVFVGLLAVIAGSPTERIVGGSLTTVNQHPFMASVQLNHLGSWTQMCGSAIINNRSVLSAAHCYPRMAANQVRVRVGSTFASSGGTVLNVASIRNHPRYDEGSSDNDIAILRVASAINLTGNVRTIRVAGASYNVADNQQVWVMGWGLTAWGGSPSEQLRQVQLVTINQNTCRRVYSHLTANMLCAGWPAGGRDSCTRDSGGPLVHNGVAVGVVSFGLQCGLPNTPGVYARVSNYASWISQNA